MILHAENLSKRYFRSTGQANYFFAVRDATLTLEPGKVTLLMGRSGSGKTTLMHMLSGLLTPTSGRVLLDDVDLYTLGDAALSRLRSQKLGAIPQGRSAIDTLTTLENIRLPLQLAGASGATEDAARWMEALGIAHLADARAAELSGGELRRMAIARALAGNPAVLLADEPTGDLDDENTALALDVLRRAAHDDGRAVFLVSHDDAAARYADRLYRMDGGTLKEV